MNESEFLDLVDLTLAQIETDLEASAEDIDIKRSGGMLILEFDDKSRIVINGQPAINELWVAAKAGGFHFRHKGGAWRNTRDGSELFASLSKWVSSQTGSVVTFRA
jgi:CyaY protein